VTTTRTILVVVAVLAFAGIGIISLIQHDYRAGLAALMLAGANGLLLA
jgi:hypothetical protein